jgi:MFS family permease
MKELMPTLKGYLDPMRSKIFRVAWTVNIISSVGSHIHYTSEKLQMRTLITDSTLHMALLESANALPLFLLGLLAGVIGDVVDRRKLLLSSQTFMLICAATLSVSTFLGGTTANILLMTSFLIGSGSAFGMPAYHATVPELIEHRHLIPDGIMINTVGYNLSRVVGPYLGGVVFAHLGASWAYCINAVSFVSVIVALMAWNRRPTYNHNTSEPILKVMQVGFKYVRTSKALVFRKIILWAVGYCWFGSVIFSLTTAYLTNVLKINSPKLIGALMSCVGLGSVIAMFILPPLRKLLKINSIFIIFGVTASICHTIIAFNSNKLIVAICLIITGMSWLAIISTVNTVIQLSVPPNLKARAFGIYHMMWGGTMFLGGIFWGHLALNLGIRIAYRISAVGIIILLLILHRLKITAMDHLVANTERWAVL